ncbi:MAG: acyl carrier protein [Lachnospiraceae bacterium]|jgi:acyl carrier protein|nr:acyl carrier protein [Lachnospiraceae bacterium]
MNELMEILKSLHPDVDFENEQHLIDDKILDSMDIVRLVTELTDKFDIKIKAKDIIPDNFNSAAAISALIDRINEE